MSSSSGTVTLFTSGVGTDVGETAMGIESPGMEVAVGVGSGEGARARPSSAVDACGESTGVGGAVASTVASCDVAVRTTAAVASGALVAGCAAPGAPAGPQPAMKVVANRISPTTRRFIGISPCRSNWNHGSVGSMRAGRLDSLYHRGGLSTRRTSPKVAAWRAFSA